MRAFVPVCLAAVLALSPAAALARPTAEVLDYGPVTGRRAGAAPPGQGGTGLAPAVPMSHHLYTGRTDAIEARLCRSSGLHLRILPGPGEPVPAAVIVRVLHPAFTAPGGATSTEDDFASAVVFGQTHVGFTFDHDWEMRPGDWTFVVLAGGAVVASRRFTVSLPPAGAPASDCDGPTS